MDTDNYEDLFLCGTEVDGSCQRIDGDIDKIKCLMAYVLDGKNRLLAIKDENGRIIARQIFRILVDGEQPVLFMERIYPSVVDKKLQDALEAFAIRRAKVLGMPLLTLDPSKTAYGKLLESYSTLTPLLHEYADAGEDREHINNGSFTIPLSNLLYQP